MTATLSQFRTFVNAHSTEAAAWYTFRHNMDDETNKRVSREAHTALQEAIAPLVDALTANPVIPSAGAWSREAERARLREFAMRHNMRTARAKGVPETLIAAVFHVANTTDEHEARRLNDKRIATRNY